MAHPLLAAFPIVIEVPVAWGEMDAFGHVNNIVYFRYIENARIEYMRRVAWFEHQAETGFGAILGAVSCRFRKPLYFPDTVLVGARATDIHADRFTMEHLLVSRKLDAVVAEGQGTVVSYDYKNLRKAPLPDVIRQRIAEIEKAIAGR